MPPGNNAYSDSDLESVISFKETIKPRRNSTGPKYFCRIADCNQSFKRLDHLDRHEYHHTGIKKHACLYDGCDKVYSILTHLKRHLRTTHERVAAPTEKNVPCPMTDCLKMFQSESSLQRHIREVHENPKIYKCTFCAEKFKQKLKLRRHEIQKHTGDYPYTCEKCSRGFYQQWQHDRHVPSCKIYICAMCDLQFDKWTNYIKHCKESQHLRKCYQCEHCERVYGKPSDLKNHIAAKHVEDELKMVFKCEICQRCYAYERNLKQHMRVVHDGQRFECSIEACKREFSSAQNLTKHLERDHKNKATANVNSTTSNHKEGKKLKSGRRKRKDAGKSIISNLAKFSGLAVERNFDKLLRERKGEALEIAGDVLLEAQGEDEADVSFEDNAPLAKVAKTDGEERQDPAMAEKLESLITAVLADA